MPTSLPLIFDAPRRAMPPRHLADLDEAGRAAAVADLGLPAFRGKQLANQYYGRLIADPHQMTDLPAAVRDQVADACRRGGFAAPMDRGEQRAALLRFARAYAEDPGQGVRHRPQHAGRLPRRHFG